MRLKQIMELKPTVLLSTPTYALAMAERAKERGRVHLTGKSGATGAR